ncbi:MAG TPA: MFS transporter [Chloroflexota bacterium]|nr:MFS transporter [Chloroflexota bacterium]
MPRAAVRLVLLWLAGTDLRLTLLAVPPVLPLIHRDLSLDEKGVAALSGLPVLLFGVVAVPGSVLIARLGARRALIVALWLIGLSSALRGLGPSVPMLFAMTLLMGAGIAICQPTMPALVRQWFPQSPGRATGFWSNGLLVGELLSASFTLPLVLPLLGSWEASFLVWSLPVLVTAVLVALATPHERTDVGYAPASGIPNFRTRRLWQLGLLQASASLVYFGGNTFIPDYLHATNQPELVGPALATLNTAQVPASIVIGLVPLRILARPWVSIAVAGAIGASLLAVLVLPGVPTVAAAGVFGFCAAYILVLTFILPTSLAAPSDVARMSAGAFAISYSTAFLVTLLAGAAWDATHVASAAFLPVLLAMVLVLGLAPRLVGSAVGQGLRAVQPEQQRYQDAYAVQKQPAVGREGQAGDGHDDRQEQRHKKELQAERRQAGGQGHDGDRHARGRTASR